MKPARSPIPSAFDLVEEAVHLLRRTPATDYLIWASGVGPFTLAALYFWADMSRAADADNRLLPAALGIALLFLWLKTCQGIFASRLHARLAGGDGPRGHARPWFKVFVAQAAWQPLGLFLLPLALVLTVPFGWLFAFHQNLAVLPQENPLTAAHRAGRQCRLWPGQNHALISLLFLAGLVVTLNTGIALYLLPQLLKMLLGVESHFTLNRQSLLNTTFVATCLALAAAALDPLVKAAYAVRCFHGESRTTGADLHAQLRRGRAAAAATALLALGLLGGLPGTTAPARADTSGVAPHPVGVTAVKELDRAIDEVLERPEFTWRSPRGPAVEGTGTKPRGWFDRASRWLGDRVDQGMHRLGRTLKRIAEWLDQTLGGRSRSTPASNWNLNPAGFVNFLMWLLIVVAGGGLLWFAFAVWRRRAAVPALTATTILAVPDLHAEHVAVEQLPEDGWLALARDLVAQGELRLAVRALHLASLAHLARREFIRPALYKSNHDYELEVRRRARAAPALTESFAVTVRAFDRAWYGGHAVSADSYARFEATVEEVRRG